MNIKKYLKSFRLRTLPLSASGIIMGTFLSMSYGIFDIIIFIFALLTTNSLQILSDLANEYGDAQKGTDNNSRIGPKRGLQAGEISQKELIHLIYIFIILSIILGIILIFVSFDNLMNTSSIIMLTLGAASIFAAIKYTVGKNAYGYKGLGDFFVLIFFGLLATMGSFFIMSSKIEMAVLLPAFSIGLFSMGVLNMNNMRDIENDKICGKITIPVKIGEKNGKIYQTLIISLGVICTLIFSIVRNSNIWGYLFLITTPIFIIHLINVWKFHGREYDSQLKIVSIATFVFAILVAIGQNI